nr:AraC family transcriptional regulator [Vibrio sinus]
MPADSAWRCIRRSYVKHKFKWHCHPEYQIILIERCNSGRLYVGEDTLPLSDSCLFVIPPGVPHYMSSDGDKFIGYELDLDVNWLQSFSKFQYPAAPQFIHNIKQTYQASAELSERLLHAFQDLNDHPDWSDRLFFVINQLASMRNLSAVGPVEDVSRSLDPRLVEAVQYMLAHYREKVSMEEIATQSHVSVSTLKRLMSNYYGKSVTEFLWQLRIGYACELLVSTVKPIALIAELSGFANMSHFNRTFLSLKGNTPREYRKIFQVKRH